MVLFTKKNIDGTIKPVWRGAKRKLDKLGDSDPAFEFEHRMGENDNQRPFVMYMIQGLPPIARNDPRRDEKNTQLARLALRDCDAKNTYCLRLEHCRAIFASAEPGQPSERGFIPVAVDQVYLNESGASLIGWMLTMFEDQAQVLDAMTANMPASWASTGPAGSTLTARPLGLHDDIWKSASMWIDLRIRTMTTATKANRYIARDLPINPTNNSAVAARVAVNEVEKPYITQGLPNDNDTPVDIRVAQMNHLVHGGDLELDFTLLRSWNDLLVPERSWHARRLYFEACVREYYGHITNQAVDMIVRGAKEPAPLQYYFLNHRHFINKFLAVRSSGLDEFCKLREERRPPEQTRFWEDCRRLFYRYIDALNDLALEPESQAKMDLAELRAYSLYETFAPYTRWQSMSIPTRKLRWTPAEHMAWEWPGLNQSRAPLTLSSPSTAWMPVPTGPGFAAAPVSRNVLPNAGWPSWNWPPPAYAPAPAA